MLSNVKMPEEVSFQVKNRTKQGLHIFPQKILNKFCNFEQTRTLSYYKEFKATLIDTSESFTIRTLDSSSSLYQSNPSLAQTLFIQELLRLCSISPYAIRIEDFEIDQEKFAYSTNLQVSLKDDYMQVANTVNSEKEIEKLIKDISKDIQFLKVDLKASKLSIDVEKIMKFQGSDRYYLKDWAWVLNVGDEQSKAKKSDQNQEIVDLGLAIVELGNLNKDELSLLKQNGESRIFHLAVKGAVRELPYSERLQNLILRMVEKDPAARPKASELAEGLQQVLKPEGMVSLQESRIIKKANGIKIIPGTRVNYPFSAHGVVTRSSEESTFWGSGVLIGPNLVLTAAFNLWDQRNNRYYPKIQFIPGINGDKPPFGVIEAVEMFVSDAYKSLCQENQTAENYGLIILKESIGYQTGYCGLHVLSDSKGHDKGKEILLTGYPKQKPPIIIGYYQQSTVKGEGLVFDSNEDIISYKMKTTIGEGGAALYYETPNKEYYVIGVHTTVHKDHEEYRSGSWIRKPQFEQIQKWIRQATNSHNITINNLSIKSEQNSELKTQCYNPL